MTKLRYLMLWVVGLLALGATNILIAQKESLIATGQPIFLELAPRDPRSLLQGDYMAFSYALARAMNGAALQSEGYVVIRLDAQNIAHYARLHTPQTPLAANEVLLLYRWRAGAVHFGAESFFFQEGQAPYYATARYAELRVAASGESVLVGLRGPNLEPLDAPPTATP